MGKIKIFELIETIADGNIGNLVPIEMVHKGYWCGRNVQFEPHKDYGKKGETVKVDLTDNKVRIEELTKLNNHITKYNKWVEKKNVLYKKEFDAKISKLNMKTGVTYTFEHHNLNIKRNEYFPLPYFEMWSFMVERNLPQQTNTFTNIKNSFLNINDEELYKLKDTDPDFVVCINKTIAEYIHGEIREALDKNRSIEDSVWNEPNNRFGNWLSQHPSDAKPYSFKSNKSKSEDDMEREKRDLKIFNYITDGLKKNRQRKNLFSEMGKEHYLSDSRVRDIYYKMDKSNELQTEIN